MTTPLITLFDQAPAPGTSVRIAPALRWVRMPLPFLLDHVNLWLVDEDDGVVLIDTGAATPDTRDAWTALFDGELRDAPIVRVIATHMHPDHVGLAAELCERFGARLWMTAAEYATARLMSARLPGADVDAQLEHFARHGIDGKQRDAIRARGDHYARLVPAMPAAFKRLRDDMSLTIDADEWRVIVGLGHSPEHAALYCEASNILIAGDMLLPRISTNVAVWAMEPEADPLRDFLASIERFRALPADVTVLPSHGLPFKGAHARVDQLVEHHRARLADVEAACHERACSASDITTVLFRRTLDAHQTTFALGEALAHLHYLWFDGRLDRRRDDDGVFRFTRRA